MSWFALKAFGGSALGILSKIPREVWYILAALVAWWIFSSHYEQQGYDKRTAEYAEIARQAQLQADKADKTATDAVNQSKGAVEAVNDKAREAAKDSDDPLKATIDAL